MLQQLTENGTITPDAYKAKVMESLQVQKTLALQLHRAGHKADAARVLRRVKVMQSELDSWDSGC